jgi:hypothetical protein
MIAAMARDPGNSRNRLPRNRLCRNRLRPLLVGSGLGGLLLLGAAYGWTFTPSYSLYCIRQALKAHDYATFSRYVDVDSVLDHALAELLEDKDNDAGAPAPRTPLAKALRKGVFKKFARDARPVMKAGLEIAVEQAVKDRDRPLPEIPAIGVIAALWQGYRDGDTVRFPVKVRQGKRIEIRARQTAEGLWRVVEVSPVSALLPTLKPRPPADQPEKG